MKKKFILSITLAALLVMATHADSIAAEPLSTAYSKPSELKSVGRLEYDKNSNGVFESEDILFDAEDLYYLWSICQ